MIYTRIVGSGSFLPSTVVSNNDLAKDLLCRGIHTSDDWIVQRTGIKQRYVADVDVNTSHMAVESARMALIDSGIDASDIDLIIVATSTPDCVFPSTACVVQSKLNASRAAAFDLQAACSGFIYSLSTAESFICSGKAKNVLVIGAEKFSRILDWNDRSTCVLFGDGAGAFVLTASYDCGILSSCISSDGSISDILSVSGHFDRGNVNGCPFVRMDGQSVFKNAVYVLEESARAVCDKACVDINSINWFIPHQANIRIIKMLSRRLGISNDKFVITVDKHANTSAASIPLAFNVAKLDGRIKNGDLVLIQGVGGGFTWGSLLVRI
ncbi:3-oxoacyl-[acyl-carrier-protein] synthase III [Candidatus Kinetoplastibacterium blastocrithidii TCC012E]|uniref:Beta-ketoacyl-[acyl-carrier-protein] synthase III n=1 Tax=Candidatus Kinetoplastidibacterium blastocrithidiae TCC012E TaxID=1208922 RepID=M1M0T7_9PROT|nr:beta-ketoacyl-ACP synthase III [Candidatus Kinetoplastibacterium blastocrithidii]AFZ83768.1 3-oxoacyl-[acyl-carrier-protein] synthase III [Candidatus Kinetoplastibacterium blastocrithidii (ex Strigomonas culicis)]AGF49891.1 3-oxoacyl-[acyl-carrier-protein] synthase III [Candidatus Kinetoplastibacterium blastocrithidii TCC012E]